MRIALTAALGAFLLAPLGCVALVAGGAAVGSGQADRNARHHVEVKLTTNVDGRVVCRVRCERSPNYCYDTVASICKKWIGDEEPVALNTSQLSQFSLNGKYEMIVVCAAPVNTEDVCQ